MAKQHIKPNKGAEIFSAPLLLPPDADQTSLAKHTVQGRFRDASGGANVGNWRFPSKVELYRGIHFDVGDARAAAHVAAAASLYRDTFSLPLLD